MVKNLIAGIDPGTTVGIAILDLERCILDISSHKNFSVNNIVEHLLKFGMPVIIATDVSDVHHTVEKVSNSFQCRTFTPSDSLSIKEKNVLTKSYTVHNDHERDALAAALKAYDYHKTKFENIDARLESLEAKNLSKDVKTLVLKDYTVKEALKTLTKKEEEREEKEPEEEEKKERPDHPEKIVLERLKEYNRELSEKIAELQEKNKKLKIKNKKIINDIDKEARQSKIVREKKRAIKGLRKELNSKKEKISELEQVIKGLKGMRTLELSDEAYTVKVLDYFTKDRIKDLDNTFKVKKGDIIYIKDPSGGGGSTAELLVDKQVKALIVENLGRMSHTAKKVFKNEEIPLLEMNIEMVENFGVVDKKQFEKKYNEYITEKTAKTTEEEKKWLDSLLKDYKKERKEKLK